MAVECTGRNVEVTSSLKELAEERTHRLERHLGGPADVRVVLSHEKHRFGAEIIAIHRRRRWKAQEETADPRAAVARLSRRSTRRPCAIPRSGATRKHRGSTRFAAEGLAGRAEPAAAAPAAARGNGSRVVRSRPPRSSRWAWTRPRWRWSPPGEEVLVFRDATSDRVSVLYRRRDGDLGTDRAGMLIGTAEGEGSSTADGAEGASARRAGAIDPRLVFYRLPGASRDAVLAEFASRLAALGAVPDAGELVGRLLKRERDGCTGVGRRHRDPALPPRRLAGRGHRLRDDRAADRVRRRGRRARGSDLPRRLADARRGRAPAGGGPGLAPSPAERNRRARCAARAPRRSSRRCSATAEAALNGAPS